MPDEKPASKRGGARAGAGRKAAEVKHEGIHISLPPWAVAMLRTLGGGSISRGIVAALERLRGHESTAEESTGKPHE
ncbi:MAG: hypothetical protein KGJ54_06420 [Betaproteobacteria bacterium]|nr:hypothetical protein [Betaproteobacteria bacterium]